VFLPNRRVKMTRLRMRVADRLKGAQNTYAMLSTFNEVDMTGLMQLRSDYKVSSAVVPPPHILQTWLDHIALQVPIVELLALCC